MTLKHALTVLRQRRLVVLTVLVLALAASPAFVRFLHPTYEATASVALIGGDHGSSVLESDDLPTLATSLDVVRKVRDRLNLTEPLETIQGRIVAKMAPRSNVMPISYRDKDRSLAFLVPNALADATVDQYRELATQQYTRLARDLRSQMANEQAAIRHLNDRLQSSVQRYAYAGSDKAVDTLSLRLSDQQAQLAQAEATYAADRAADGASIHDAQTRSVVAEQAKQSDPYYQALNAGEAKDAAEYQFEKAGYTDSFPGLVGLKEKVALERRALNSAGRQSVSAHAGASSLYAQMVLEKNHSAAIVAADQARVATLASQVASTMDGLREVPRQGVDADDLRLNRDSAAAAYQQLAIRLQTTMADESQAANLGSLVVIDRAIDASPRMPPLAVAIILSVLIFALAFGSAFVAEMLDPRIRSDVDIERLYGSSSIGSIH